MFHEYESNNLLLLQAYEEVMDFQLEEGRLRRALDRISKQKIIVKEPDKPTPFAFPIMVDRDERKANFGGNWRIRVKRMMMEWEE